MIALAVATVVWWAYWQNGKHHWFSNNTLLIAAVIGLPSGIIFSKLLHVIDQFGYYQMHPGRIFSTDGLAIWGAVLGAALGIWIYSLVSRQFRFSLFGDMIAPGIILAQAIGRVGCTINGCCYGIESHSPLAVIYTITPYAPLGIPTLPVVVFEIVYNLVVFGILLHSAGETQARRIAFPGLSGPLCRLALRQRFYAGRESLPLRPPSGSGHQPGRHVNSRPIARYTRQTK